MSHKILFTVSVLPALLIMPAMAAVTSLNDAYNAGSLNSIAANKGKHKSLNINGDINLISETADDIIYASNATVDVIGNNINLIGGKWDALYAANGATVNLTAQGDINVESNGDYAIWAYSKKTGQKLGGQVNINANSVKINGLGELGAILIQNVTTESTDRLATVNIKANNVEIESANNAVVAMSQGVFNLEGNAKISAINAIQARGNAQVTINKSGEYTTIMNGNIAFGYNAATSGTAVDAVADVTFAGAESVWTGNTIALWDSKPEDLSKLKVSQTTITLDDGATWNATKITDADVAKNGSSYVALNNLNIDDSTVNIADTERGIFIDNVNAEDATFNGGPLQINKVMNVTGIVKGDATLNIAEGATLNLGTGMISQTQTNINGVLNVDVMNARNYGRLFGDVTFGENAEFNLNVATAGTYQIFDTDNGYADIKAGGLFDVQNNGADGVVISTKDAAQVASESGLTNQAAETLVALANTGGKMSGVSLAAQSALAAGDVGYIEAEVAKTKPISEPVTHSVATTVQNQVLSLVSARMAGAATGRSGGDFVTTGSGMWAQGMINRSKMNGAFHGDTLGVAVGIDATFNRKYTIGMGYAYGDTDVHANTQKTDIESNTLFAYAQYKPNKWFINGAFNYTFADYTDKVKLFGINVSSDHNVDSYGAQLMSGYDFASGVTPSVGVRYLHITQDAYNNGLANVKSADTDFLTGVAGVKYDFDIAVTDAFTLQPELRAAAKYDFLSDESTATVLMPGAPAYVVNADRLSRFGGEFGIGVSALYRGVTVSLSYDLDLRKDYTSQTGMLKLRYNF